MSKGNFYQGRNVRIRLGDKTIYHATSAKISVSADLEEIATKDTDGKVQVFGGYAWNASAEALVANLPEQTTQVGADDLLGYLIEGTELEFQFTTSKTGDFVWSGNVLVSQCDVDAQVSGAVKGSFSFVGQGDLKRAKVV